MICLKWSARRDLSVYAFHGLKWSMHHINIKYTATIMTIKCDQTLIKWLILVYHTSPMPCNIIAMQIVHHSSWHDCLLDAFYSYACALYLCWPLLVWFFFRIDAEQGIYQENQEHYPDPSLASTELPGKHYHMLAYIQYLLPLSYSCIIESRMH